MRSLDFRLRETFVLRIGYAVMFFLEFAALGRLGADFFSALTYALAANSCFTVAAIASMFTL